MPPRVEETALDLAVDAALEVIEAAVHGCAVCLEWNALV